MKDYVSVTHATSNEDGKEELTLEQEWPTWKFLWLAILDKGNPQPRTNIQSYVVQGTVWVEKETGKVPNSEMQFELFEAKGWIKSQSMMMDDHFGVSR